MRVLVLDDDFRILKAVRRMLSDCETYIASDVRLALSLAERHQPEVIVVDAVLNDESGLEAIHSLKACAPLARVIVMSGSVDLDTMDCAYASGADAYVPKTELAVLLILVAAARQKRPRRSSFSGQ